MRPRVQWNVKGIKNFHNGFVYCELLLCNLNCFFVWVLLF